MFDVIMLFYICLLIWPNINTLWTTADRERFSVFRVDHWVQKSGHLWHKYSKIVCCPTYCLRQDDMSNSSSSSWTRNLLFEICPPVDVLLILEELKWPGNKLLNLLRNVLYNLLVTQVSTTETTYIMPHFTSTNKQEFTSVARRLWTGLCDRALDDAL
jgi:hypothetical protein